MCDKSRNLEYLKCKIFCLEMQNEREKIARDMMVNTQIISASINGKKSHMAVLPEPVFYTLEHKTVSPWLLRTQMLLNFY